MYFLIKPASGRCNLRCEYCFYHDEAENRSVSDYGLMDLDTAHLLVQRAFELDTRTYEFAFQGGEPTLAGLDFFKYFVSTVEKHRPPFVEVRYSLQTNGTALTPEWVKFFKKENFLLGLSLDGPRLINDGVRKYRGGGGSYRRTVEGLSYLKEEAVPVNVLCVVTDRSAENAGLIYRHLRRHGFDWIQFIPCLDPLGGGDGNGADTWSLSPEGFSKFHKEVFDLWYGDYTSGRGVSVRYFDNLVGMAMGYPPESCGMAGRCGFYFTLEANGSVYPCDFYVTDKWKLGNIRDESFKSMAESPVARRFISSSEHIAPECRSCFCFPLCRGGCRRDRDSSGGEALLLNRLCAGYREFFRYAGDRILLLAEHLKKTAAGAST